jgi:hypothetical protein
VCDNLFHPIPNDWPLPLLEKSLYVLNYYGYEVTSLMFDYRFYFISFYFIELYFRFLEVLSFCDKLRNDMNVRWIPGATSKKHLIKNTLLLEHCDFLIVTIQFSSLATFLANVLFIVFIRFFANHNVNVYWCSQMTSRISEVAFIISINPSIIIRSQTVKGTANINLRALQVLF